MSTVETKDIVSVPLSEILSEANECFVSYEAIPPASKIGMMKEKYYQDDAALQGTCWTESCGQSSNENIGERPCF